jgi:mono/diheme cytochrome c family protein
MRHVLFAGGLFVLIFATLANGQSSGTQTVTRGPFVPSGDLMYAQYCAACHGRDAKGNGPVASGLKTMPPDLTTLAKRHGGKFPYDYLSSVLRFGLGPSSHGSSEMPTWGPLFKYADKNDEQLIEQRIKNMSDYLASVQQK